MLFQEYTSKNQDFFSTYVQFQDFSGPERNENSNFRTFEDFSGPVGTLVDMDSMEQDISVLPFRQRDLSALAFRCHHFSTRLMLSIDWCKLADQQADEAR